MMGSAGQDARSSSSSSSGGFLFVVSASAETIVKHSTTSMQKEKMQTRDDANHSDCPDDDDDTIYDKDCPTLTCLISISEVSYFNDSSREFDEEENLVCIAINVESGRLGNDLVGIEQFLPDIFHQQHERAIEKGEVFLRFRGVVAQDDVVAASTTDTTRTIGKRCRSRPCFERIDPPPKLKQRQLEQQHGVGIFGNKTLAMVRVMTRDSQPVYTAAELQDMVLNSSTDRVNVITQYRAMSFGQFNLVPVGVFEVLLNQNASSFASAQDMYGPIETALMERYGIVNASSEFADYVFFCIPPGLQKGFIAFTSRWHWRSMYSDKFCASLAATIHEFGHQIGLGHSDEHENGDYNDLACYMSQGGDQVDHPRQSFNGQKNWMLGWFQSRHLHVDPFEEFPDNNGEGGAFLIDLATIVDFDKAMTHQPVIVAIREDYYLQYNCAKGFNAETRDVPNTVTVTANTGFAMSLRSASLDTSEPLYTHSNYTGSGRDLIIYVCEQVVGNNEALLPDVMRISIGLDSVACEMRPAVPTVSPRPTAIPTLEPTRVPSTSPSFRPSTLPSASPRPSASAGPTYTPTTSVSPSMHPTVAPFTKVTYITPVAKSTAQQEEQLRLSHTFWLLMVSFLLLITL
jgi:hypothetical protein